MALPALETDSDPTPFRAGIRCPQCATLPICFIGSLTEASHNRLAPCVAEHAFRKGQLLQPEGCVAQQLSVVKLGTVALRRQGKSGQPQPLAMLGRGQALGGYAIYGHAEPISAVALSAGRICRVEVADLYRLGLVDRRFHASMQQHIVRSHGHLADWARVMHIKNIRQRVLATLQLYAREQRVSVIRLPGHVALSTLLSTTRETVARSLQQLEASGHIVRHDRWHCEVIPPPPGGRKKPA